MSEQRYIPAAGRAWLTPIYDSAVRLTTRERWWRPRLIEEAAADHPATVLDVGCGTATLAIGLARRLPHARVIGLDPDPDILARATAKVRAAGVAVELTRGMADAIGLPDGSVDVALCSLVMHHLTLSGKRALLRECRRVLAPSGRLLICDYGTPPDPVMRAAFLGIQLLDGFETTGPHAQGQLAGLIGDAGFAPTRQARLRTVTGALEIWSARR